MACRAHNTAVLPPVLCCRRICPSTVTSPLDSHDSSARRSFLERPDWGAFRSVLAVLRETCPPAKPVIVRTSWLPQTVLGECIRRPERYVIRLNDTMPENIAVETLLHEWAHALAWNFSLDQLARALDVDREEFERASHDEAWGCAYSRVWRAYAGMAGVGVGAGQY